MLCRTCCSYVPGWICTSLMTSLIKCLHLSMIWLVPLQAVPIWDGVDNFLLLLNTFRTSPPPPAKLWISLLRHGFTNPLSSWLTAGHVGPTTSTPSQVEQVQGHFTLTEWSAFIQPNLFWLGKEEHLLWGQGLHLTFLGFLLFIDASTQSWSCSLLQHSLGEKWSQEEAELHINPCSRDKKALT